MSTQIRSVHIPRPAPLRDELDDCISEYERTLEQESWPECKTCRGECYFVVATGQRYGFLTWIDSDREKDPDIYTIECETCGGSGKQAPALPSPGEGGVITLEKR